MSIDNTKICFICKKERSVTQFYRAIGNKDGRNNKCRLCCIKENDFYRKSKADKLNRNDGRGIEIKEE